MKKRNSNRPTVRRPGPRASRRAVPLSTRLARVKLFLCDVDGVLTSGSVFMGGGGEWKEFNIQDGLGLRLLQREGIKVGWISARPSAATAQRAADLQVDFLNQDQGPKVAHAEAILRATGLGWEAVCYVGDDVVDLGVLRRAGLAVCVANGIAEAKALAHYVTRAEGGRGAVREVGRMILEAQGRWDKIVREFSG